jgi:small subunit ribosomal protein S2
MQKEETQVSAPAGDPSESVNQDGFFAGFDFEKLPVSIDEMFKNGVHFGHHKSRKNPKMDEFIFGTRNGINIIDLQKTAVKLGEAAEFISRIVALKQDILLVGTKKQAKSLVQEAARICSMPYINERWLGGTFTNFSVISKRTRFLREGQAKMKNDEYSQYTKYEQMKIAQELDRLEHRMGGIKEMQKLPGAVFVVGILEDDLAIKEAKRKNIPVIALVDTNVNPELVDYPIPANEDAVSSIRLMLAYIIKIILDSKNKIPAAAEAEKENKI